MDNKYSFHSNCGCLHSDSDAALKAFSEETSQDTGCSDYYSQTNLHNLSDPDSLKKIIISKESIHALRLNTLQKRILMTLNGIQLLLSNGPQPDGVEDLKRRQQRAAEFSSRFCRNYLYQLQRQINNITKMWKSLSNNHSHASYFVLCQKVITAHQNAHLALQAYLHHMPCSVERGIPDKLEEILQVVNDLCSFCSKLGMSEGDSNMKVVKQCCEQLMIQIKSKEAEKWEGSCTSPPHSSGQKAPKPFSKKEMIPYRFSMYSGNAIDKTSNQNKKTSKISVGLSRKPSKLQCNKYNMKEPNLSNVKQNSTMLKNSMYVTYGSDREDKKFGEVSSGDNVRTMMECFLAEEHSQRNEIMPTTPNSNATSELVIVEQKEGEETSIQNYKRTLRKLELEINNLKERTQSLKENGHPNYPIYINMLETMFHQLNRMKSQKQKEDMTQNLECEPIRQELKAIAPPSLNVQIQNENTTAINDSQIIEQPVMKQEEHKNRPCKEYSKNVKLVCLTSKTDKLIQEDSERQPQVTAVSMQNEPRTLEKSDSNLLPIIIIKKKSPQSNETLKCRQSQLVENSVDAPNQLSIPQVDFHRSVTEDTNRIRERSMCKNEELSKHSVSSNNLSSVENNFKAEVSDPREVTFTHLNISQSELNAAFTYHQDFQNYTKNQSLYEETIKPWQVTARIASNLLENVLEDIVLNDTGIQKITSGLLQLEFQ